jgi:(R,R)-butanediol dehydrogenase/meso-butanediol dehydrogenase/diacetyl reductase
VAETMQAAVFRGDGRLELEERPVPKIEGADDVILDVGAVGICGTDLHILNVPPQHPGRVGIVMGHEFAGTVVAAGEAVSCVKPGDHVIVDQNAPCGACEMCRRGLPNACIPLSETPDFRGMMNTYGIFQDGALAKYVRVKGRNVIPIADSVPMWQASMAEPLACCINGSNKAKVQPGESAVVVGAGPIGLLYVSLLKASGAGKLIAVEPSRRRQQAALACGATMIVDPTKDDIRERVLAETNGRGADVVVEAVGPMIDTCIQIAGPGARLIQFGHDESAWVKVPPARIVYKELQIFGVFLAKFTFESAKDLLEQGSLPLNQIVSHRLPLSRVHEGIELLRTGEAIKVIIHPGEC